MTLRDKLPIGLTVPAQPVEREAPPAGDGCAKIADRVATEVVVRGLIERDTAGALALTDRGSRGHSTGRGFAHWKTNVFITRPSQ
jgi:hypothetical protein